jgi:hypothetical protein
VGVTRPRAIEVHIDELVLHGFDRADRHRIGDAVRIELTELLAAEKVTRPIDRSATIERLDGGSITPQGPGPRHLGEAIARSVSGGLSRWAG